MAENLRFSVALKRRRNPCRKNGTPLGILRLISAYDAPCDVERVTGTAQRCHVFLPERFPVAPGSPRTEPSATGIGGRGIEFRCLIRGNHRGDQIARNTLGGQLRLDLALRATTAAQAGKFRFRVSPIIDKTGTPAFLHHGLDQAGEFLRRPVMRPGGPLNLPAQNLAQIFRRRCIAVEIMDRGPRQTVFRRQFVAARIVQDPTVARIADDRPKACQIRSSVKNCAIQSATLIRIPS